MNPIFERQLIKYQNLKQILQDTVETAREILKCDRVIIYNASDLPKAGVLAESNDQKCVSLLGKTIHDPFLEGDYLEMYCYGMSLTIDNIYASDVSKNNLIELEKLGVKSVAVAPIYIDNKLLAFLVAHQCFQLQPWGKKTVDLLAAKASAAGESLAAIAETEELSDLNLVQQTTFIEQERHSLFAEIKSKITEQLEQKDILPTIVTEIRRLLKCDRVLIYSCNIANHEAVVAESVADGWTKVQEQSTKNSHIAAKYLEENRHGQVLVWNNTDDVDAPSWYREQLEVLNVKAGIIAPIIHENQLFGLLIVHQCSDIRSWQQQEIYLITQIANYINNMPEYIQISNDHQQEQLAEVQKQLEQERMWTKHFAKALQKIRQSFKIQDILDSSVREVHRIFNCDRVLIYALHQKIYGKIVAESVSPGWKKTVGMVIKDPCFEAKYLAK
ncbi:MAG: GAF domain-containing protein [Waterburya sp.]